MSHGPFDPEDVILPDGTKAESFSPRGNIPDVERPLSKTPETSVGSQWERSSVNQTECILWENIILLLG